jgi:hypothetical protein
MVQRKDTALAWRQSQFDSGWVHLWEKRHAALATRHIARNPCSVVDQDTGRVWLPFCRNNDEVLVTFSDDHGQTWKLGGTVDRHTDECQVVELSDGTLMINMRNYWGRDGKEEP